ncbi:MAG: 30S ribosomal protein S4 [Candidatus Margulisbacteria bacterium]|jgi:small subunit ribosomal protein S4|nr:30S ribosomal protein S4 [Candidatus Margulisiibacteriota bacterium]
MGKHKLADCKQCRREGERLLLKGDRCNSQRCALLRCKTAPGMHGAAVKKQSEYAVRLREKQKLRRIFGLSEKQMWHYFANAHRTPGVTGTLMLQYLERRLDNIAFRLGFAASRKHARQLVKHGHFQINGRKVDLPSYLVAPEDKISIKPSSQKSFEAALSRAKEAQYPAWLKFDPAQNAGLVLSIPSREEIDYPIDEQLIVEHYAK